MPPTPAAEEAEGQHNTARQQAARVLPRDAASGPVGSCGKPVPGAEEDCNADSMEWELDGQLYMVSTHFAPATVSLVLTANSIFVLL